MGWREVNAEHDRQKRMEVEGARLLIRDVGGVMRWWRWPLVLLGCVMVVGVLSPHRERAGAAPASCGGRVVVVSLPESRYPGIVEHIRYSWSRGYPKVLRIHREGASGRRDRLLGWWERRHPQPRGDGLDLDEEPATVLRDSWRADVRPIPAHENRSAGASLGAQIAGYPDGTCVRYAFKARP